jgi:chromate transporter
MNQIPILIRVFAYLSILTVGGGMAAFPEMETLTVNVHHWLQFHQLIHLYSIGQLAPGPNMMMIVSIGDWAVWGASGSIWLGIVGGLVVLVAFFGPTAVLALVVGRLWAKLEKWPWRKSIQDGLASVSVGLLLAGTLSMAKGSVTGWTTGGIALAVVLIMIWRKVNPALLVLGGALIGGIAFMPK